MYSRSATSLMLTMVAIVILSTLCRQLIASGIPSAAVEPVHLDKMDSHLKSMSLQNIPIDQSVLIVSGRTLVSRNMGKTHSDNPHLKLQIVDILKNDSGVKVASGNALRISCSDLLNGDPNARRDSFNDTKMSLVFLSNKSGDDVWTCIKGYQFDATRTDPSDERKEPSADTSSNDTPSAITIFRTVLNRLAKAARHMQSEW